MEREELKIDPEFSSQIPPLDPDEYEKLEASILEEGAVINPIVVWNGFIVDGHNRYDIIRKHQEQKIRFDIYEKEFPDRYAALAWICQNQLGRRNLTPEQKKYLVGQQYEAEKQSNRFQGNRYTLADESRMVQNEPSYNQHGTRSKIATENHTSESYVRRAEQYAKGVNLAEDTVPGTRQEILSGEIKPTDKEMAELLKTEDPDERKELVEKFHEPKSTAQPTQKKTGDKYAKQPKVTSKNDAGHQDDIDSEEEAPVTHTTIREIEEISAGMVSSDGKADEDDVIFEMNDALETLIFRWNTCTEMNPEAIKKPSYRRRRNELIKKGEEFLHTFRKGGNKKNDAD